MTKAVGYIRVSTQGQVRDGNNLAYQRDEITRYYADNEIELIQIYEDKGISGAKVGEDGLTVEREGLQSMLADLATVSVDCVIVLNTLLVQYQRFEIALKLSRGRREKAEQGGYAGGGTAFGYRSVKGQKELHIDPEQANTGRRVFEPNLCFSYRGSEKIVLRKKAGVWTPPLTRLTHLIRQCFAIGIISKVDRVLKSL